MDREKELAVRNADIEKCKDERAKREIRQRKRMQHESKQSESANRTIKKLSHNTEKRKQVQTATARNADARSPQ